MADRPAIRQCNAMTQRDAQCRRLVNCDDVIAYPNSALIPVPLYCPDHLKSNLVEQRFRCLKYPDQFIDYNDEHLNFNIHYYTYKPSVYLEYIPSYLEPHTKVLLREEMRKWPSRNDKAGYIYVLDLEGKCLRYSPDEGFRLSFLDRSDQDLVRFKVGWTVAINRRLAEHNHKCDSSRLVLLSFYPPPNETNEPTPGASDESTGDLATNDSQPALALSMIRPGEKVPYSCALERLIHLELADVAANSHPVLGIVPGAQSDVQVPRQPCVDCK